eukprot:COSAG01_NODE_3595_length_5895_cov_74.356046_3_plen_120_part_00
MAVSRLGSRKAVTSALALARQWKAPSHLELPTAEARHSPSCRVGAAHHGAGAAACPPQVVEGASLLLVAAVAVRASPPLGLAAGVLPPSTCPAPALVAVPIRCWCRWARRHPFSRQSRP